MEKLLSMILIACDRRRNPAAERVWCQASQAYESLVQCARTAGVSSTAADNYTKFGDIMRGDNERRPTCGALTASGDVVSVRVIEGL